MPITTCNSPETLKTEIETVRKKVTLDETEDTWDTITHGILHLTRICNNGGCEFPSEMVAGIRTLSRPLNNALNSERSRLSGATVELLTALAIGLGSSFDPLVSQFVPTLLALCGRTNKVFTSRARACILVIIQHTRLPSLLPYLSELANHKSVFPRLTAAEGILACLNCFNPPDLEKDSRARAVEDFIKLTARDASADVRKASKEIFKAYKVLMPARLDSFVAPLTPVVKKYLDIQIAPSGISSITGQKQTGRPPSRANTNNKVTDAVPRPASSTLSKHHTRPATNDPTHGTRQQRPVVHGATTGVVISAPRQRTISQMYRDPPQPRNLHINVQSSGTAQRCVVPTSVATRQAGQQHPQGPIRVLPVRNVAPTGGPQRPPPVKMTFNPPPDRLKVTGDGARRIPLPSVPVDGHANEQVALAASSGGRVGSTVDKAPPNAPSRNREATAPGKSTVSGKIPGAIRSASSSTKAAIKSTGPVQRSHQLPAKGNHNEIATQRHPVRNVQKSTRPLTRTERKETSPSLIPLPPSPSISPTEIPLPASPATLPESTEPAGKKSGSRQGQGDIDPPNTPITTLLSSIQRGFLFTPSSPLSPPQNYLPTRGNFPENDQNTIIVSDFTKVPVGAPLCIPLPLEEESVVEELDRHALRDLN